MPVDVSHIVLADAFLSLPLELPKVDATVFTDREEVPNFLTALAAYNAHLDVEEVDPKVVRDLSHILTGLRRRTPTSPIKAAALLRVAFINAAVARRRIPEHQRDKAVRLAINSGVNVFRNFAKLDEESDTSLVQALFEGTIALRGIASGGGAVFQTLAEARNLQTAFGIWAAQLDPAKVPPRTIASLMLASRELRKIVGDSSVGIGLESWVVDLVKRIHGARISDEDYNDAVALTGRTGMTVFAKRERVLEQARGALRLGGHIGVGEY